MVSDDVPVMMNVFEKEESLSSGQRRSCCSLPGLPHHPGEICLAAGSLFSRDEWLSRPSHRPGTGLPPSPTLFCFAADSLLSRDEWSSSPSHHPGSGLPLSPPRCSVPRLGGDVAGVDALKSNWRVASSTAVSVFTPFPSRFSLKRTSESASKLVAIIVPFLVWI